MNVYDVRTALHHFPFLLAEGYEKVLHDTPIEESTELIYPTHLKEGEITDYGQWILKCGNKAFLLVKVYESTDFIAGTHLGRHVGLGHKDTAQFTSVEVGSVVCKALDDKSIVVSETNHCLLL